ncbi:MAG: PRC-barrel domain-containing protein [Acetobacteraceae bacterium]
MASKLSTRGRAFRRGAAALSVIAGLGCGGHALAQAPKPEPGHAAKPMPPKLEKVEKTHAEGLLGQPVLDAKRETIGHIVDVLIDTDGKPDAAVIEFTGFLGVGNRKVAVAWKALHFTLHGDRIVVSVALDGAALRAMPGYNASAKSVPVAAPAHKTRSP